MNLIDTHCHLGMVEDLDAALVAAKECGVTGIIAVGEDFDSNQKILEIVKKEHPIKIYPALGLHPGKVSQENLEQTLAQIEQNAGGIIAIAETGLDFWINPARKDPQQQKLQVESFKAQIHIAIKHNLALSIHSRGAWKEAFDICKQEGAKKCIFHWYTGSIDVLSEIIETGYCISVTPALEYSPQLIEAAKNCPLDRILLETDAPVTYKPKDGNYKSQPKDVARTLKALAAIKGKTLIETAAISNNSAGALFNLK